MRLLIFNHHAHRIEAVIKPKLSDKHAVSTQRTVMVLKTGVCDNKSFLFLGKIERSLLSKISLLDFVTF